MEPLYGPDCVDVLVGTKASCGRQLAESVVGCVPHYAADLAALYRFELAGSNFVYIRVGRKDGKRIGKREGCKVAKRIETLIG